MIIKELEKTSITVSHSLPLEFQKPVIFADVFEWHSITITYLLSCIKYQLQAKS